MSGSAHFRLEVFRGISGFERLKPDWKLLISPAKATGFYHCAEWYEAYIEYLENDPESFRFYGVFEADTLVAVFPLRKCVRSFLGIRFHSLELPRHAHMPLGDIVLPETDRAGEIWRFFLKQLKQQSDDCWDFIRLSEVPENSTLSTILTSPTDMKVLKNRIHGCLYCSCSTPEDLSQTLSRSFRKSLRNARNRLSRMGDASFFIAQDAAERDQVFQDFLRLEASGWKARAGTAIAQNDRLTGFYRRLTETFGSEGCVLDKLSVGDEVVAANFNLMTGATLYGLKTGIDEQSRLFSPAHLLMERELTQTDGFPQKPDVLNFVGDASWTSRWKPASLNVFDVYVFNTRAKANVAFAWVALEYHLRMLYRRMLKPLIKRLKKPPNRTPFRHPMRF